MRKVVHIKVSSEDMDAMIEFAIKDGKVRFEQFLIVVEFAQNTGINGTFSDGMNGNNSNNRERKPGIGEG